MFYNETKTIELVSDDPSLVFELIKEGHLELVDKLLTKKIVDINICDEAGNNILVRLLKQGAYELVLKHMKNKDWDVNHQNLDDNTFAHYYLSRLFFLMWKAIFRSSYSYLQFQLFCQVQ